MIKFVSKIFSSSSPSNKKNKKEPIGGQAISFDDIKNVDAAGGQLTWKSCEPSFEDLLNGELTYSHTGSNSSSRAHPKGAHVVVDQDTTSTDFSIRSRDPSSTSCSGTSGEPSTEFGQHDEGPITPKQQQQQQYTGPGMAIVRRSHPTNTQSSIVGNTSYCTGGTGGTMYNSLVNETRGKNLTRLVSNTVLNQLAQTHAKAMADSSRVFHSNPNELVNGLPDMSNRRLGENVFRVKGTTGKSMAYSNRKIQKAMLQGDIANYANLNDPTYKSLGMATARDCKGVAYICILFLG